MVRSMIAGVAGLKAHQQKMDVIGNNIANVNTWGFKGFSYNFTDAMYTNSIRSTGGSIEAGASGGRNASQVGYGSQLSSISNVFENGAPSPSANPMDCMIDGTGFFLVGKMVNGSFTDVKSSGLYLSRVGIFRVDDNKYLVDDQRNYVYGYSVVEGTGIPETPATSATVDLSEGENPGAPYQIIKEQKSTIDANGNKTFVTDNNGNPVYVYKISIATVEVETTNIDTTIFDGKAETDTTNHRTVLSSATDPLASPTKAVADWVDKALKDPLFADVTVDYKGMTSKSGTSLPTFIITSNNAGTASTTDVQTVLTAFGMANPPTITEGTAYVAGIPAEYSDELSTLRIPVDEQTGLRYKLDNYSINEDGIISGVDENNRAIIIGKLALVQVQNPNGLEKTTGYYYQIGDNAGEVNAVAANTGPAGVIKPSYLEMANVDLANEFSNIITTQRGFQANSKIITVTDEMLQELVNMKR